MILDRSIPYLFSILDNNSKVHSVIKYLNSRYVIKITRRGKNSRGASTEEFVVTVGAPNYAERKFIKIAKKANEPFPIKKIQIINYKNK